MSLRLTGLVFFEQIDHGKMENVIKLNWFSDLMLCKKLWLSKVRLKELLIRILVYEVSVLQIGSI